MSKVFKEAKGETSAYQFTLRLVKSDVTGGFLIRTGYMEKATGKKTIKVLELWAGPEPLTNATEAKRRFDMECRNMGAINA
jgi:hypothetical protein